MVILSKSIFCHIRRSGGTWVRHALKRACPGFKHDLHEIKHASIGRNNHYHFVFTFVRNPAHWLYSWWRFCQGRELFECCASDDWEAFLGKYIQHHPGSITEHFCEYTEHANYIGRQERLVDDLVTALDLAGEEFDERLLRETPRVNEAPGPRLSEDDVRRICTVEPYIVGLSG